jgi:hypothetical protein
MLEVWQTQALPRKAQRERKNLTNGGSGTCRLKIMANSLNRLLGDWPYFKDVKSVTRKVEIHAF